MTRLALFTRARAVASLTAFALVVSVMMFGGVSPSSAAGAELETGSISGRVTYLDGVPIADAYIRVRSSHDGTFASDQTEFTNMDGTYTVTGLAAGSYALEFSTSTRHIVQAHEFWRDQPDLWSSDLIELGAGEAVSGIDVSMGPGVSLSGRVTGPSDEPIPGSTVGVHYADGAVVTTVTDDDGRYFFEALMPGTVAVSFEPPAASGLLAEWWYDRASIDEADWRIFPDGDGLSGVDAQLAYPAITASTPSISGVPAVGSTLVATTGEWSDATLFAFQWLTDGVVIDGATAASLQVTSALVGKRISVQVTGSKPGFNSATKVSAATTVVARGSLLSPTPVVTGIGAVGSTLTASTGAWTAGASLAYQWYANGVALSASTAPTLVLQSTHKDKQISVRVTGTLAGYTTVSKVSAATAKVAIAATPRITGAARVGSTLTAVPGTWTASTTFAYQWYADDVAISGATKSTFIPTTAQDSKAISVAVRGTKSGYATVKKSSASTFKVMRFSSPTISGTPGVGFVLTAKPNTWSTGTLFTYQWMANGTAISGATSSTFTPKSAQHDQQLTVKVTGKKAGTTSVTTVSSPTAKVATTSNPSIAGTAMVGATLTAKPNTWTSGTSFRYQWYADGVALSGATASTFKLSKAHSGKVITVRVAGALSGYVTISRTSAATGAVRSGKSAPATRDNCPSAYPIKGNQTTQHTTDWIYHVPGGQYYAATDPEECFATEAAAVAWGYRKSQR